MYFSLLNGAHLTIIFLYAAYYGWFGQGIQAWFVISNVNDKYDKEILLAIALAQAGTASAEFESDGLIRFKTDRNEFRVVARDFADESFGECYMYKKNYGADNWSSERVHGTLSYKTRQYLLEFKEEFLGIADPSGKKKFTFKKDKITIK